MQTANIQTYMDYEACSQKILNFNIIQIRGLAPLIGSFDFALVDTIPRPERDKSRQLMLGTSCMNFIQSTYNIIQNMNQNII
jgi:hypothetical protein